MHRAAGGSRFTSAAVTLLFVPFLLRFNFFRSFGLDEILLIELNTFTTCFKRRLPKPVKLLVILCTSKFSTEVFSFNWDLILQLVAGQMHLCETVAQQQTRCLPVKARPLGAGKAVNGQRRKRR